MPKRQPERSWAPNNLPTRSTPLVGRAREVEDVRRLLSGANEHGGDRRLLTLVGPGGVGKTRLALQVAQELAEEPEDDVRAGVYFVELASVVEAGSVVPAIATLLQVGEEPGAPLLFTLVKHLRDKRMLLVLDNFEQVLPAGSAVEELLAASPELKVLATSRAALGLQGEQVFEVAPLTMPSPASSRGYALGGAQLLLRYGAVELFVQRAVAVRADFELTEENAGAVVEICRRVDGLPLAIELVAAHSRLLSAQSILARLKYPLRLLGKGPEEAPLRQRTMRDTIEWSYRLLGEEEQRLFRCLSVFTGGFEVRAAEAVCNRAGDIGVAAGDPGAIEILEGIETLVDKSLLRPLEPAKDGDRRLAMLETVREYASEQLAVSGEAETIRGRHADYYLSLAQQAAARLKSQDLALWLKELDPERDNFRAALNRLIAQGEPEAAENALRMVSALSTFWHRRSQSTEFQSWLERALAHTGPDPTPLRVQALRRLALLASKQADYPRAAAVAEEALAEARELGDKRILASCLNTLAGVASVRSDYDKSRILHEESLAIYRELGATDGIAMLLNNLGLLALDQGDYERAESLLTEALDLARGMGSEYASSHLSALANLGRLAHLRGDLKEAKAALIEALTLALATSTTFSAVDGMLSLSSVILDEANDPQEAPVRNLHRAAQVVRLAGFSARALEMGGRHFEPLEQAEFERNVSAARARLGEEGFAKAWEAGQAMTLDQAFEVATQGESQSASGARGRPRKRALAGLTGRELEVAGLVTQGLSNEEIASKLVLSERTVEMHVSNALHKLGLTTRTQFATWGVEQGLKREG